MPGTAQMLSATAREPNYHPILQTRTPRLRAYHSQGHVVRPEWQDLDQVPADPHGGAGEAA